MSSNNSDEATAMSHVTTIPPSTNEIKARENSETLLLRLPLELKTRIYEFVCGGQTVHMCWGQRGNRLCHHLCRKELSEEETQKKFDTSEAVCYVPETAERHIGCCTHPFNNYDCPTCKSFDTRDGKPGRPPTEMLETSILHCCRQMHLEAQFVPYYANTFSFSNGRLLVQFCRRIPEPYKTVIRRLHVEVKISARGCQDTSDWNLAFQTVTTSLKCLQRLYISMELIFSGPWPCPEGRVPAVKSMLSHILQAGKLDLNVATVVLWESLNRDSWDLISWSDYQMNEFERLQRWTLAQQQEWSRYLRRALLHYEDRDSDLARLKREALEEGRVCRL